MFQPCVWLCCSTKMWDLTIWRTYGRLSTGNMPAKCMKRWPPDVCPLDPEELRHLCLFVCRIIKWAGLAAVARRISPLEMPDDTFVPLLFDRSASVSVRALVIFQPVFPRVFLLFYQSRLLTRTGKHLNSNLWPEWLNSLAY